MMDIFKEFEATSIDDAIREACLFYATPREKLEIDIVHDAKNGIFGLVGVRKACIKARRVATRSNLPPITPLEDSAVPLDVPVNHTDTEPAIPPERGRTHNKGKSHAPKDQAQDEPTKAVSAKAPKSATQRQEQTERAKAQDGHKKHTRQPDVQIIPPKADQHFDEDMQPPDVDNGYDGLTMFEEVASSSALHGQHRVQAHKQNPPDAKSLPIEDSSTDLHMDDSTEGLSDMDFDQLDHALLLETTKTVAMNLIKPISDAVSLNVQIVKTRVDVHIDCGEDSGIVIGREGQTLVALQYLVARLVSRIMGAAVRVQLDVGDYRLRQDERLKTLALSIAERVHRTGKSYSTRPMSSYHRRIVHVALQNDVELQTRSYGEGALKRVIVYRRRPEKS